MSTQSTPNPEQQAQTVDSVESTELAPNSPKIGEEKTSIARTEQQTLQQQRIERLRPFAWKPGESGNPGGRPKRKPITEFYQQIVDDPAFAETFRQSVMKQLQKGSMVSAFTLKEMADRVEGRVTEKVEVNGDVALSIAARMQRARERDE